MIRTYAYAKLTGSTVIVEILDALGSGRNRVDFPFRSLCYGNRCKSTVTSKHLCLCRSSCCHCNSAGCDECATVLVYSILAALLFSLLISVCKMNCAALAGVNAIHAGYASAEVDLMILHIDA